jgi:TolA-binding protein
MNFALCGGLALAPMLNPAPAPTWRPPPQPALPAALLHGAGTPVIGEAALRPSTSTWAPAPKEALQDAKLQEEITLSEDLLRLEKGCAATVPVRFRLADRVWEQGKRAFLRANDDAVPAAERAAAAVSQRQLQDRALVLYGEMVAACPQAAEMPQVLFSYGRALRQAGRPDEAKQQFARIVKAYPKTDYAPQAHFMLGEMLFEAPNQVRQALRAYQQAAQPRSLPHGFALYKQAWCYINLGKWNAAQACVQRALAVSVDPREPLEPPVREALRQEALKDYVRIYAHVGTVQGAAADFAKLPADAPMQQKMLQGLLDWYLHQGEHRRVLALCAILQAQHPTGPQQILYQSRIVAAQSALGNLPGTAAAVQALQSLMLANPQVLTAAPDWAEAQALSEGVLRRLAIGLHQQAKKLHGEGKQRYLKAALPVYDAYLRLFVQSVPAEAPETPGAPGSSDGPAAAVDPTRQIYRLYMQFYAAEVHNALDQLWEAAEAYEAVVRLAPAAADADQRAVVDAAVEGAVRAYDSYFDDQERLHPALAGDTNVPLPIGPQKQRLLVAGQRYLERFGNHAEHATTIRYKLARLYYAANQFAEASRGFAAVYQQDPEAEVACFAANLQLDIYNGQKDYAQLRDTAHALAQLPKLRCSPAEKARFSTIEQEAGFKFIGETLEKKQDYLAAGDADLDFFARYPQSRLAPSALSNAAIHFERGHSPERANAMRRLLLSKYPRPEILRDTLPALAEAYERSLDFDGAATAWTHFADQFEHDGRSHDALYNATLYQMGLHGPARTQAARDQFVARYPKDPAVERFVLSGCDAAFEQGQASTDAAGRAALATADACYRRFVSTYADRFVEAACVAQAQRSRVLDATGRPGPASGLRQLLLRRHPMAGPKGRAALRRLPRCAAAVAAVQLRELEAPRLAYQALKLAPLDPTPGGRRAFDRARQKKISARDRLIQDLQAVVEVGAPEPSAAALYRIGEAYLGSAEALLRAPLVARVQGYRLTAADKEQLHAQVLGLTEPIVDQARQAFGLCESAAQGAGRYSEWPRRAAAARRLHPASGPAAPALPELPAWQPLSDLLAPPPLRLRRASLVALDANRSDWAPAPGADPNWSAPLAAGDVSELVGRFDAALRTNPQAVDVRLGRARLILPEQPAAALAQCRFVLGRDPQQLEAYRLAVAAAQSLHRFGLASLIAERASRLAPADSELLRLPILLARRQGDLYAEVVAAQALVAAAPAPAQADVDVLARLATLAYQHLDDPTAEQALRALAAARPDDAGVRANLDLVLRRQEKPPLEPTPPPQHVAPASAPVRTSP